MDCRRYPCIPQLLTVVAMCRRRTSGEPGTMKGGIEPITTSIAGEHATGAVRAMGTRRESDDPYPRPGTAEPRYRPTPIGLVSVSRSLVARHLLAPVDQSRAGATVDDSVIEFGECGHRRNAISPVER